jgi:hypothetical protein
MRIQHIPEKFFFKNILLTKTTELPVNKQSTGFKYTI